MLSHSTLLAGIFRFAPSTEAETWATLTARCNPCQSGESPPLAHDQGRQAPAVVYFDATETDQHVQAVA